MHIDIDNDLSAINSFDTGNVSKLNLYCMLVDNNLHILRKREMLQRGRIIKL